MFEVTQRPDLARCLGRVRSSDRRSVDDISRIVIHRNTTGETVDEIHRFFSTVDNAWSSRLFPYHFVVDDGGIIFQIHPLTRIAPHAGSKGWNRGSIGIAINTDCRVRPPPADIFLASAVLVAALANLVPSVEQISPHREEGDYACPGARYPMEALRSLVGEANLQDTEAAQLVESRIEVDNDETI